MRWRGLLGLVALIGVGCDREPVREWSASDHDQTEGSTGQAQGAPRADAATVQAQLVEVTWGRQCATCHGASGRGDGPSGPMVSAPDLTRADWQGRTSDEQIARAILEGKGKMPRFDLPPATVAGLVKRVRQLRAP